MSELILPDNMPNFQGNERSQKEWLNGKPSRMEMLEEVNKVKMSVMSQIQNLVGTTSKIYVMVRTIGLQLDTVNELLDKWLLAGKRNMILFSRKQLKWYNFLIP